jgi:steroid delta-isomerase
MSELCRDAIRQYFEAVSSGDADALVALFAEDAHFNDPVGTPVLHGHDGVRRFHKGLTRAWERLDMDVETAFIRGDRGAAQWTAEGRSTSGKDIEFEGINLFEVDDAGRITRLEGYWDFEDVIGRM